MIPSIRCIRMVLRRRAGNRTFNAGRNRLNGRIENCIIGEGFSIRVQQSFGNCPNTFRHATSDDGSVSKPMLNAGWLSDLGDNEVSFIAEAYTFFIHPGRAALDQVESSQGLDVSPPWWTARLRAGGFAQRTLLSDFSGNLLFTRSAIWKLTRAPGFCSSTSKAAGCCTSTQNRICWTFRGRCGLLKSNAHAGNAVVALRRPGCPSIEVRLSQTAATRNVPADPGGVHADDVQHPAALEVDEQKPGGARQLPDCRAC